MLPNKWQFDTSQDWKVLKDDFGSVSSDIIPDDTLQTLRFHIPPLDYHKEETTRFINVTHESNLAIEPEPV